MTTRERAILGLDLGTNEVKAGLVTLDGRLLGLARAGFPIDRLRDPGWAEQDPGAWWAAIVSAVRALRRAGPRPRSSRSAWTATARRSSRSTRAARPTRPAITWLDTRSTARGGRAGRGDRRPRLGPRGPAGRALGRAPRAGRGRRDALVPRDLGVAGVPARRRRGVAADPRPARPGSGGRRRHRACRPTSCRRPARPARSSAS